jgi:proteasome lid subunit RPN8/RPN11
VSAAIPFAAAAIAAIRAAAAASPSREVCGLLLGGAQGIVEAVPTPNRAAQTARNFAVCPAAHARIQREARAQGLGVTGCYHSHPGGEAIPSGADAAEAEPGAFLWAIATPEGALALWRAERGAGRVRFVPVPFTPAVLR